MFSCEYCKIFKNSFFRRTPSVAVFGYSNQLKIFQEITASKFQWQHAAQFNFCVDMKVYALQLKLKSTVGVSNGILKNFRTANFENKFRGLPLKRKQRRRTAATLAVSGFHFFTLIMKQCSFSTNFCIAESVNLDCIIHIYIPKKGLSSPVFTIKILVVEIFGCY